MSEPWKHDARWKKAVTNNYMLYDQLILNVQNKQIYRKKVEWWLPRAIVGGGGNGNDS